MQPMAASAVEQLQSAEPSLLRNVGIKEALNIVTDISYRDQAIQEVQACRSAFQ